MVLAENHRLVACYSLRWKRPDVNCQFARTDASLTVVLELTLAVAMLT